MHIDDRPHTLLGAVKESAESFFTTDRLLWGWRERADAISSDPRVGKLDLAAGILRDREGNPPRFGAISQAEAEIARAAVSHGYLPPAGLKAYREAIARFLFADSFESIAGRSSTVQTIGGAGALRIAADCLSRLRLAEQVYVSAESWADHKRIFERAGLAVRTYPYLSGSGEGVDYRSLLASVAAMPAHSVLLLQACCHNPTGYDLPEAVWKEILALAAQKKLLPLFDVAYPGLGGGVHSDLLPLRLAAREGLDFLAATSCCKSFSLYDSRLGALTAVLSSPELAERFESQVKIDIQASYSSPPRRGAEVVARVLGDTTLRAQWEEELQAQRRHLEERRALLASALGDLGAPASLLHIREQRGLFGWTGLDRDACKRLAEDFAIYIPSNGRICIGALPAHRIKDVAFALFEVSHRKAIGSSLGLVDRLVEQTSAVMLPSSAEWVRSLDVRAYAVRQATSCVYLETLFPRIISAAPDSMKERLGRLLADLASCHRRQFEELSAVVDVPRLGERRSYYFDSMYAACNVPPITEDTKLDEDALLRLLGAHAVSYRRGWDRYALLKVHIADENRDLVPIWSKFFFDAPRNSRLVTACMFELFGEARTSAALSEAAHKEGPVMKAIWTHDRRGREHV